jgi:hypothetical protein
MKNCISAALAACVLGIAARSSPPVAVNARPTARAQHHPLPADATHCGPSLPINIELMPQNDVAAGNPVSFDVRIESRLDPDLVKDTWVEYEIPPRVRQMPSASRSRLARSGRSLLALNVAPDDRAPHPIRARLVVQLADGQTISRTATRWINLTEDYRPDGMVGRIVDYDGTGIRVYQGATVRQ